LELEPQDLEEFHTLTRHKLCASRRAISEAMAFCFEHGSASTQISQLLEELILDCHCSIETRISRLYLLSDVLFNSQQPGVKNAFRYRDAIEKMAHDVFYSLGQHGGMSRMTKHKMQTAVRTILSAWTNWSVFDHSFLDELETRFEGREIIKKEPIKIEAVEEKEEEHAQEPEKETIILAPPGDWVEVNEEEEAARKGEQQEKARSAVELSAAEETPQGVGSPDDEDIDGEPLEEGDLDEEGLKRLHEIHQVSDDDGESNSENLREPKLIKQEVDVDGEPLERQA
jgi:U2-associated protein SR140